MHYQKAKHIENHANAEVSINISDWFSHGWSPNPENSMKNLDPKRKYMSTLNMYF